MNSKDNLQTQVMIAARNNGISSVLFRNAVGRRLGLSVTESECLSLLTIKSEAAPTEIARYTSLTTGATTTMLDRLEKMNLIIRTPNPSDRRGVLVKISELYAKRAMPIIMHLQKSHTQLLAPYTDTELETIKDFLIRFSDNVTAQTRIIEENTTE